MCVCLSAPSVSQHVTLLIQSETEEREDVGINSCFKSVFGKKKKKDVKAGVSAEKQSRLIAEGVGTPVCV